MRPSSRIEVAISTRLSLGSREPSLDRPLPVLDRARRERAGGGHAVRVEAPADHPDAVGHVGRDARACTRRSGSRPAWRRGRRERVVLGHVPPGHARVDVRGGDRLAPAVAAQRHPAELGGRRALATRCRARSSGAISASATAEITSLIWDGASSARWRVTTVELQAAGRLAELVLALGLGDRSAQHERRAASRRRPGRSRRSRRAPRSAARRPGRGGCRDRAWSASRPRPSGPPPTPTTGVRHGRAHRVVGRERGPRRPSSAGRCR